MDGRAVNWGPTYGELADPASVPEDVREAARIVRGEAVDPLNLFNLHWMDDLDEVTALLLPSELTGVSTRIALLLGDKFPAGVVHAGAAFAMLAERQVHEEIRPGRGRVIVPATGAFAVGAAWAARAMGYPLTAVLPRREAAARAAVLEGLGATVEPGGEGAADALDTIDAAWALAGEHDAVLNPYADFAAYRFHAVVTAAAIRKLASALAAPGVGVGVRRLAAFVAPTGAGALLAAADGLEDGVAVIAAEPEGCAPLAQGTMDTHDIPDGGARYPAWTDHVDAVDYAVAVPKRDVDGAVRLLAEPPDALVALGVREPAALRLSGSCGPAACLALVAALKAVKALELGSNDLVVVAAPEGQSVAGPGTSPADRAAWLTRLEDVRTDGVVEATAALRRRWHYQKLAPWVERRGKGEDALRRQRDPEFWAEQRRWAGSVDARLLGLRGPA